MDVLRLVALIIWVAILVCVPVALIITYLIK
jgi:hypothetical protein